MSTLGPPPPGVDLTEDRRSTVVAVSVVVWLLGLLAVVLRLVCRRIKHVEPWWDDWLIVAALVPSCAHVCAMAGYAVSRGLGRHIWVASPDAVYAWAISLFIAELSYSLTLMCVKWSILAFYWRSFNVRHSIKVPIWILAAIVGLWGIAVLLVSFLQCQPLNAFWDRFDPVNPLPKSEYHCGVDARKFFYGNAIPNIATDVLMLALPAPYIWNLQLPGGQKVALVGVFLVGSFVTAVSIVRLNFLLQGDLKSPDITWNFVDTGLWSIIEGNIAIVCACLPFLRPILQKLTFGILNLTSLSSQRQQQSTSTVLRHSHHHRQKEPWEGGDGGRFGASSSAHVRAYSTGETDEHPFAHLTDDGRSDQSLPLKKKDSGSIELRDVSKGGTSPVDGIVVTREVRMEHRTA